MENEEKLHRTSRELRTPITEAAAALNVAWTFFVEVTERIKAENPDGVSSDLSDPNSYFIERIFSSAFDDPNTDGDASADRIGLDLEGQKSDTAPFALIQVMETIVAYVAQAFKAAEKDADGENFDHAQKLAWSYAIDATYWSGILKAEWGYKQFPDNPATELAKKRHAENYELIKLAQKHWKENIDPSLSAQKAANHLIGVVPLSHKKLAEVVSAEKKKMRREAGE